MSVSCIDDEHENLSVSFPMSPAKESESDLNWWLRVLYIKHSRDMCTWKSQDHAKDLWVGHSISTRNGWSDGPEQMIPSGWQKVFKNFVFHVYSHFHQVANPRRVLSLESRPAVLFLFKLNTTLSNYYLASAECAVISVRIDISGPVMYFPFWLWHILKNIVTWKNSYVYVNLRNVKRVQQSLFIHCNIDRKSTNSYYP